MSSREERLLELLCDEASSGLPPAEEAEARALLQDAGPSGAWERHSLERAAVAVAVAGSVWPRETMPTQLIARIEQQGLQALGVAASVSVVRRARRWPVAVGWIAAATCLMMAGSSWFLRPREVIVTKTVLVPASAPSSSATPSATPATPLPEAEREGLLARDGTEKTEWSPTKEDAAKSAAGDVVWNQTEQRGFMRFHGLAKNDPSESQYQLWIFDKTRDARYPVDGGVFDIGDGSHDVIVPIHARIPVGEPVLFAVTVEKPGGVVVSKREHIVLTAKTRA
jgi:hypothetical protein